MRRTWVGAAVATALFVMLGSLAWACVSIAPGPTALATPDRVALGAPVQVTGGSWAPATPVSYGLGQEGGRITHALGTASPAADGTFSAEVRPAGVAPGVWYLVVVQGDTTRNVPLEVIAGPAVAGSEAAAPAAASASDDLWAGLADATTTRSPLAPGPTSGPAPTSGSAAALVLTAAFALLAGALAVHEVRRRRVPAHRGHGPGM